MNYKFVNVVGDLHGDLNKARCALEIAGVLSSDGRDLWIGGETVCLSLAQSQIPNWNSCRMNFSFEILFQVSNGKTVLFAPGTDTTRRYS